MKSKQFRMTIMYKLSLFAMDLLRTGNASKKTKSNCSFISVVLLFEIQNICPVSLSICGCMLI